MATETLPQKFGFGLLHNDSIVEKRKWINAQYYSKEGDLVYDVLLKKNKCRIEEYFENRTIGITKSKSFFEAVRQKFSSMARDPLRHPRFNGLIERITRTRNIRFQPSSKTISIYVPAGLKRVHQKKTLRFKLHISGS